ncbi:hypothetical protein FDG62_gp099 [Mycobacterium phage Nepal]|uniref:Uncharacterized protein n=1 Tax=Mycobacterium phage Nepal TaxID=2927981 RepID=I3WUD4_9CAUD|nr:hypothetical protein FDG62_gp099 [Mycobacterium phage Nepal]AFL46605.1 hypothetical protein NEPAL_99 [Mycobacterium phage Nepal]
MRQALGTEDAPSSVLTRLRMRMRCGSGSTGLRIEGMAELRDRADVPGSKLAFDVDRIDGSGSSSSDASRLRGSIARRMMAGISLRWSRCSRSISWFEGVVIGPLPRRDRSTGAVYREAGARRSAGL